jgi:ABC-type Zn uptake system ZnuABC Zn-binding protein ZnuA
MSVQNQPSTNDAWLESLQDSGYRLTGSRQAIVTKIANSQVLIGNGAGLEEWLQEILDNAGGERLVIETAEGLSGSLSRAGDPHFWLDPNNVIHYAEEIRE